MLQLSMMKSMNIMTLNLIQSRLRTDGGSQFSVGSKMLDKHHTVG